MRAAPSLPSPEPPDASLRRRGAALALTLLAHVLLILMLLTLAPPRFPHRPEPRLITFDVPPPKPPSAPTRARTKVRPSGGSASPRPRPVPPPPPPAEPPPPLAMMIVPHDVFAAADIGKLPPRRAAPAAQADAGSGDTAAVGTGPGGERIYRGDWYRLPTAAELAFYLRRNSRSGWGEILCKTIPNNRIDDCKEYAESPGSGLARAMREASWQFLIRPPRIGSRPVIGGPVIVHFDYDVRTAE